MWACARDAENPFLAIQPPKKDASLEAWQAFFPLNQLPPLPERGKGYWTEPLYSIVLVGTMCYIFVTSTTKIVSKSQQDEMTASIIIYLSWFWAGLAVLATTYILVADAGQIVRSPANCYPIPEVIAKQLAFKKNAQLLNIENLMEGQNLVEGGHTYCVRCCVWRKGYKTTKIRAHHCKVCQRCYESFDHHCSVFGRCIVKANMPCYFINFVMLFAAMVTIGAAVVMNNESTPYHQGHSPILERVAFNTTAGEATGTTMKYEVNPTFPYVLP